MLRQHDIIIEPPDHRAKPRLARRLRTGDCDPGGDRQAIPVAWCHIDPR